MKQQKKKLRKTTRIEKTAGCRDCEKQWKGRNAQGCAGAHTKASGHRTWCKIVVLHKYHGHRNNGGES